MENLSWVEGLNPPLTKSTKENNLKLVLSRYSEKLSSIRSPKDFYKIDEIINQLSHLVSIGELTQEDLSGFLKIEMSQIIYGTLQGQALLKPFGYAGDFSIIDKIYTRYTSADSAKIIWDQYFHTTSAVNAVRNRKSYFKQLVKEQIKGKSQISILNLASGPCRDVKELMDEVGPEVSIEMTCVDMDERAIDYGTQVLGEYASQVKFVNKNILRYTPESKYNLVWSAGLFDYFDDRVFTHLLGRAIGWVKPRGSLVIGNFNEDHNPSRAYMELFGEWYLNHRTEDQLIDLAKQAGAKRENISVGKEEENVNLFLSILN